MAALPAPASDIGAIRKIIARHRRWDFIFGVVGILALMLGVLTFVLLFVDMAIQGLPRLSIEFFTNFPSRRAAQKGRRLDPLARLHH